MSDSQQKDPVAGGVFVALGVFAGTGIGVLVGQLIIGFLAGLGAGIAVATGVELWQRLRR